jgi:hypothetical protein
MEVIAESGIIENYHNYITKTLSRDKTLKTLDDLINLNLPLLRLSGVRYLITDGYLYTGSEPMVIIGNLTNNTNLVLEAVENGYNGQQEAVFRIKDSLSRLDFFENYTAVTNNQDALDYLASPSFDLLRSVVIDAPVTTKGGSKQMFAPQKINTYKTWDVKSVIDVPADGFLLFNTMFDPGWKAFVDEKEVQIYRTDYIQMGIFVKSGRHSVEFRFEPDPLPFMISLFTVLAGVAAGILYFIYGLVFKKKPGF